jgi:hypothetical protein
MAIALRPSAAPTRPSGASRQWASSLRSASPSKTSRAARPLLLTACLLLWATAAGSAPTPSGTRTPHPRHPPLPRPRHRTLRRAPKASLARPTLATASSRAAAPTRHSLATSVSASSMRSADQRQPRPAVQAPCFTAQTTMSHLPHHRQPRPSMQRVPPTSVTASQLAAAPILRPHASKWWA